MSAICAGLTVLSLCIPLPGHTRAQVEASDWPTWAEVQGAELTWFTNKAIAVDGYKVSAQVTGEADVVSNVIIIEAGNFADLKPSRLEAAFKKVCLIGKTNVEVCKVGKVGFSRHRCGISWTLSFPDVKDTQQSRDFCESSRSIQEDIRSRMNQRDDEPQSR